MESRELLAELSAVAEPRVVGQLLLAIEISSWGC